MPPQAMSANEPMSNGTWRQDLLPAAALVARGPICIEGRASAQAVKAVKAQWLCTCYTWPGSSWRPSACEADVIATRPQVLAMLSSNTKSTVFVGLAGHGQSARLPGRAPHL